MNDLIRVVLIEDNAEYRAVIHLALEGHADLELITDFGSAEIALREMGRSPGQDPEIILLDIRLPGMTGLEALPLLQERHPGSKIIMLTQYSDEGSVLAAIAGGASGYILKSATASQIADGIRTVAKGGATLDSDLAHFVLKSLQSRLPETNELQQSLTKRELDVLAHLGEGLVKKEIAERLGIGYTTVDTHVSNIYRKLRVTNAAAAIHQAHRRGLLSPRGKE